ncbi:MAG: hypothetical protein QOI01_338 [Mycobacterium sp.]|jgi:hypothetical protein|nr:hypothetical protein [Mycobacterium sp.]
MSTNRITSGTERTVIENLLDHNREALIATASSTWPRSTCGTLTQRPVSTLHR